MAEELTFPDRSDCALLLVDLEPSLPSRNDVTDAITRSPTACDRT
jgi:hypothetical protein